MYKNFFSGDGAMDESTATGRSCPTDEGYTKPSGYDNDIEKERAPCEGELEMIDTIPGSDTAYRPLDIYFWVLFVFTVVL